MTDFSLSLPTGSDQFIAVPVAVKPATLINAMISSSLDSPVGCPKIEDTVSPGQKICIILDDNTRRTPVIPILNELLPRLLSKGIKAKDIFMVFALGSHRKMTKQEMLDKVGPDIFNSYAMYNSEFSNPTDLVVIGRTEFGTDITVTSRVMDSDIRIGIGSIVPHTCLGWSGGAKILFPGVTGENIVSEFHAMEGLENNFLFGQDNVRTRLMIENWASYIGLHFIINCILLPDGTPYGICSGHYIKAHRCGCRIAKEVYGIPVPFIPDITVVYSYPLRQDFWQCTKALESAAIITKTGGHILLSAPCDEGIGPHPDVVDNINRDDGQELISHMLQNHCYGEKLLSLAVGTSIKKVTSRFHVSMFCDNLDPKTWNCNSVLLYPEAKLQSVLDAVIRSHYNEHLAYPKILIIPSGGESLPYCHSFNS